ncbi:site-specific integrase, partial [Candidatus Microgenomates bacterium]|nr:site-specific integrase [Candidatus Microgenomates bacterium]
MDQGYNFANIEAGFKIYISSGNKSLRTNTVKNYISDLRYFLGWYQQTYKSAASLDAPASSVSYFDHIDTNSIKRYIDYLNLNNTSSKTVKRRISSLSGFLKYLLSNDLIVDNYLKTLKKAEKELTNSQPTETQESTVETTPEIRLSEQDKATAHSQNSPLDHDKKSRSWSFALIAVMAITSIIFNSPAFKSASSQPTNIPFLSQVGKGGTRVLTFRGRLTDTLGNPINQKTDVRFKLYKSPTANGALFESNACTVYPDVEGNFEVAIGSSERNINTIGCDKKIPSDLFTAASPLYLGVTVGTNAEMKPRQQIANVGLADSAMKISGMALGSGTNNIPYINSRGEISLQSESPDINASSVSDDFKITSSRSLLLQTGADGDLNLSATESGRIRFLTGGSETERLVVAQNGNVGVGTANPAYFRLEVSGSVGPLNRICFDENERYCTTGLEPTSVAKISTSVASGSSQLTGDLLLGGTATASANIKLSGTTGNPSFIRTGYLGINTAAPSSALAVVGSASFGGNTIDITTHADEDLTLVANGSGVINLDDQTNVGGNFAAGTTVTSGTTKLDIAGTATVNALCHQTQSGTDNEAIVDCSSTPTADFAEMYPVQEGADYGEVMSLSSQEVQTTDGQYIRKLVPAATIGDKHLLGVISDNYGDFISVGHNLKKEDNPRPIALKGRVPVKIASSSEDIKAGDYLTSSKEPGRASKATHAGVVIG